MDDQAEAVTPFPQLRTWLEEAKRVRVERLDIVVMCLSTCSRDARPTSRMVVAVQRGEDGIGFFTDRNSMKARQLAENPFASAVMYFPALDRQIRVEGKVEGLPQSEADQFFKTLPREKQLMILLGEEGRQFSSFQDVLQAKKEIVDKFENVSVLPASSSLAGYLLVPSRFQFHQNRPDWVADCVQFSKQEDGSWNKQQILA